MKLSIGFQCPNTEQIYSKVDCCNCSVTTQQPMRVNKKIRCNLETLFNPIRQDRDSSYGQLSKPMKKLGDKWKEYQGIRNWEGLLDPLDENLRGEILRYGAFVEAAYKAFEFDPSSPNYGACRFSKSTLFDRSGLPPTGYKVTKHLRATSGVRLPHWVEKGSNWMAAKSSWIGYVAVCNDKDEIARLGRRDVVIAFRGTATCLEWLENLRANLTKLPDSNLTRNALDAQNIRTPPMVESGFLSLYTSRNVMYQSLQEMVQEEITRLLETYSDEPLSLTITGHSLGAALATLTAHDIKTTINHVPLMTVISFGGPRVGNHSFRQCLEKQGTKVLRIVNSDDLITKVPGFVIDRDEKTSIKSLNVSTWIRNSVQNTQWMYADIGKELRLNSKDSPHLNGIDVATCHDLKTYLHLINGFVSSSCPFRASAKNFLSTQH